MLPSSSSASFSSAAQKLAVLISGRGSNLSAIISAIREKRLRACEIAVVVSNRKTAKGLEIARAAGIPIEVASMKDEVSGERKPLETYDAQVLEILRRYGVDAVALAGYGRIVSHVLLEAYAGRIVNIHPSLLPDFGGEGMLGDAVHQAVLESYATCDQKSRDAFHSGCSVHLVTATVDGGPVLGQAKVRVLANDSVESLAQRVLAEEHRLYPMVLERWVAQGYAVERFVDLPAPEVVSKG